MKSSRVQTRHPRSVEVGGGRTSANSSSGSSSRNGIRSPNLTREQELRNTLLLDLRSRIGNSEISSGALSQERTKRKSTGSHIPLVSGKSPPRSRGTRNRNRGYEGDNPAPSRADSRKRHRPPSEWAKWHREPERRQHSRSVTNIPINADTNSRTITGGANRNNNTGNTKTSSKAKPNISAIRGTGGRQHSRSVTNIPINAETNSRTIGGTNRNNNTGNSKTSSKAKPNISAIRGTGTHNRDKHQNTVAGHKHRNAKLGLVRTSVEAEARSQLKSLNGNVQINSLPSCSKVTEARTRRKPPPAVVISKGGSPPASLEEGECSEDGDMAGTKSTDNTQLPTTEPPQASETIIGRKKVGHWDRNKCEPEVSPALLTIVPKKPGRWSSDSGNDRSEQKGDASPSKKKTQKDRWASPSESSEEDARNQVKRDIAEIVDAFSTNAKPPVNSVRTTFEASHKKQDRWASSDDDAPTGGSSEAASASPKDRWASPSPSESSEEDPSNQVKRKPIPKVASQPDLKRRRMLEEQQQLHHKLISGCRSITKFQKLNRIAEGTYGIVFRAMCLDTRRTFALKKVKIKDDSSGFPITALREINVLLSLQHENIIGVKEMVVGRKTDEVYMVMDYMEHDIKMLMDKRMDSPFSQSEVKCLMKQLLSAMHYMHSHWYLHRDLKTSNLLYGHDGRLRVCDFGLARRYGEPLEEYTFMVVTQWYRPPELLMGQRKYSTAVDMWGVGCIFAELLRKEPLFRTNKESAVVQLQKIFSIHGTPIDEQWPGWKNLENAAVIKWRVSKSKLRELLPKATFTGHPYLSLAGMELLEGLLRYDPTKRISASTAFAHRYFTETPVAKEECNMPTFPATTDGRRYKKRTESSVLAAMS